MLTQKTFLEFYTPPEQGQYEPHAMPGFLNSKHTKPIQLLVANLTSLPMKVKKGQLLAYAKVCDVKDIKSMHPFGTLEEFNLPVGDPQVLLLFKAKDFPNLDGDQI